MPLTKGNEITFGSLAIVSSVQRSTLFKTIHIFSKRTPILLPFFSFVKSTLLTSEYTVSVLTQRPIDKINGSKDDGRLQTYIGKVIAKSRKGFVEVFAIYGNLFSIQSCKFVESSEANEKKKWK